MNITDSFLLENLTHTNYFLNPNEYEKLLRYGAWASALANGEETPTTERQSHFVAVCLGEMAPETDFEFLWLKYKETIRIDQKMSHLIKETIRIDQKMSHLIEDMTRNQHDSNAIRRSAITDAEKAKTEIEFLNTRIKKLGTALSTYERKINSTQPRDPIDKYTSTVEVWREQS